MATWDIAPGFHWASDTWEEEDGIVVILVAHPGVVMEGISEICVKDAAGGKDCAGGPINGDAVVTTVDGVEVIWPATCRVELPARAK